MLFKDLMDDFLPEANSWDLKLISFIKDVKELPSYKKQTAELGAIQERLRNKDDAELAALISFLVADIKSKSVSELDSGIFEIVSDQVGENFIETVNSQPLIIISKGGPDDADQYKLAIDTRKIPVRLPLVFVFKMMIQSYFFFNLKYSKDTKLFYQLVQLWLGLHPEQVPSKVKNYRDSILRAQQYRQ